MARIDTLANFLTDVAAAIKEQTGNNDNIRPSNFDTEILRISAGSGGDTPTNELPAGYQKLTFVQSMSTDCAINTGVTFNGVEKVRYDFKFKPTNPTALGQAYWGCYENNRNGGTLYENRLYVGGDNALQLGLTANTEYEGYIKIDTVNKTGTFYANNGAVNKSLTYTSGYGLPIYNQFGLFCQFAPDGSGYIQDSGGLMTLYYFKMYLDDVLVRDFVPCCRKSDGAVGLYDLVNNNFHNNEGTGTLGKGVGEGWITDCSELCANAYATNITHIHRLLPHCKPITAYKMFFQNKYIVGTLDTSLMDMSNCLSCESMFEDIAGNSFYVDLSNFNTSSCINMQSMFIRYPRDTLDLTSFDTSKVTNMSWMFYGASSIRTLDLSSFDFSKVVKSENMFTNCYGSLTIYVKDEASQNFILNLPTSSRPSSWSTSNVIIKSE